MNNLICLFSFHRYSILSNFIFSIINSGLGFHIPNGLRESMKSRSILFIDFASIVVSILIIF